MGTHFSEILIGILSFPFKKMHLKLSSAKMTAILSRGGGGTWRWVKWYDTKDGITSISSFYMPSFITTCNMLSVIFFSTWAISFQYFVHVAMQNFPWGRLRQSISQQQIELMNVRCITLCGSSPEVHWPGNVSLSVLEMSPFWRIFRHCLHRNLSKSQLWVQRGLFDKKEFQWKPFRIHI